jgi:hypothetical protein
VTKEYRASSSPKICIWPRRLALFSSATVLHVFVKSGRVALAKSPGGGIALVNDGPTGDGEGFRGPIEVQVGV